MKRFLTFIFALMIVFCFSACNTVQNPVAETTVGTNASENIEPTTIDSPSVKQMPMYSVALPITTQTEYAADGTILFHYSYQNIELIGPDQEVADAVIVDFLNRVDSTSTYANNVIDYAKSDYPGRNPWSPYFLEVKYSPLRLDQSVLCLFGKEISYSGGAHGDVYPTSVNYDLTSGKVLRLTDILVSEASVDTICTAVISFITQDNDTEDLYEGFEDTVKSRFAKSLSNDQQWHLDANGLTIYFSPYEIAPYASGIISATIPYDDLVGILKDAYFPIERDRATGTLLSSEFSADTAADFSQFSEIVLDDNGKKFILYTDASIHNLGIYTGTWPTEGGAFTSEDLVFFASSLTPGDAVMVEAELNTEFPSLYLSFVTDGKTVACYVMLDKETGELKLTAQ